MMEYISVKPLEKETLIGLRRIGGLFETTNKPIDYIDHCYFQTIVRFENGYGASIIDDRCGVRFIGEKQCYEIAVLDQDGNLTYDSPITNDTIRGLKEDELIEVCKQIRDL